MPWHEKPKSDARSVRLALGAEIIETVGEKALTPPAVRLTVIPKQGTAEGAENDMNRKALAGTSGLESGPTVRLAHKVNNQGDRTLEEGPPTVRLVGQTGGGLNTSMLPIAFNSAEDRPALLVSYVYLEPFLKNKARYHYRDWVLDSGAFSAHNSGTEIRLQDFIDCAKRLLAEDTTLTEVFGLDVIGDWKAGLRNCEKMWRQGIEAIPTFHYGEPWDVLGGIAKDYPKIALGGCVGKKDKDKFAGQCFGRVWPKRIHGFGFGSEKSIMMFPWHSVDATNWEIAPCKYGQWKAFGTQRVSVRGSRQNLRAEVEWYLDLERRARERWRKEMVKLAEADGGVAVRLAAQQSIRLAADAASGSGEPLAGAIGPTVRLVGAADDITDRRPIAFSKRGDEQLRSRKRS